MRLRIPMRRAALFGLMLAVALIAFLPLRLFVTGIGARSVGGSIWVGRIKEARVGPLALGDLNARLSPLSLLGGKLRFVIARPGFTGAFSVGGGGRAAESLTGNVVVEGLPITSLDLTGVTVRFRDGRCDSAEGLVRANTDRGSLEGAARCDRGTLLLPLAGASGQDRLELRLFGDGRYEARLGKGVPFSGRF